MSGTSGWLSLGALVCSLKVDVNQVIPDDGGYHVVRFPFGSGESSDRWEMHQVQQPDGYVVTNWAADDRSGLIWPARSGWGHLYAMIQWESGPYTELRDQYVRDPLGLTSDPMNTTATDHRPPSPGMQCFTKSHGIFVNPSVPLALRVGQNAGRPVNLVLAEFKLVIYEA
ncbi:hypothetical protein M2168_002142 [Streptomyces sp. CZ24]|uniref:hypothetical protein n=1 Tax=Streptomyces albidoflavus TaxID=1886 RepID=UPI00247CDE51|nr:hypothetical protein [Streptomyces sp. CZ24]